MEASMDKRSDAAVTAQHVASQSFDFAPMRPGAQAVLMADYINADRLEACAGEIATILSTRKAMNPLEVNVGGFTFSVNPGDLDARPIAVEVAKLENIVKRLLSEEREDFAFTGATGAFSVLPHLTSGNRSTSRKKTKAERSSSRALIWAYCDAIQRFTQDRTRSGVAMRLREEIGWDAPETLA